MEDDIVYKEAVESCKKLIKKHPWCSSRFFHRSFKDRILYGISKRYTDDVIPDISTLTVGKCNFPAVFTAKKRPCTRATRDDSYFCGSDRHREFAIMCHLPLRSDEITTLTKSQETVYETMEVKIQNPRCTYEGCNNEGIHPDHENDGFYYCDRHVTVNEDDLLEAEGSEDYDTLKEICRLDELIEDALLDFETDQLKTLVTQRHTLAVRCGRYTRVDILQIIRSQL